MLELLLDISTVAVSVLTNGNSKSIVYAALINLIYFLTLQNCFNGSPRGLWQAEVKLSRNATIVHSLLALGGHNLLANNVGQQLLPYIVNLNFPIYGTKSITKILYVFLIGAREAYTLFCIVKNQ